MTVSPYEPQGGEVARYSPMGQSVRALRDWAEAASAAHSVATSLCKTSFVPKEYRGKPDETTAAILAGMEIGLSPIASVNAYSPIQGQAAPKAITLRAIVQSRGHEIELLESTSDRCIMRGRRHKGDGEFGEWQTVTWTVARARQLKLLSRDQWQNQPTAMLVARATSEISRIIGADAILGIPYSVEELYDQAAESDTAQATATNRSKRRTPVATLPPTVTPESIEAGIRAAANAPAAAGPPPLPGEPGYATEDTSAPEPAADGVQDIETVEDVAETDAPTGAQDTDSPAAAALAEHFAETFDAPAAMAGDETEAEAADVEPVGTADHADAKRMARLFALLREAGVGERHQYAAGVLGRKVTTFSTLSAGDVGRLISNLEDIVNGEASE